MKRRPLTALLIASVFAVSGTAHALDIQPFEAAQFASLQKAGKPVALHFHADWCPTCVNQSRALEQLKAGGQLQGMTVLVASYDKETDLKRQHKVRSQSVLIVFKGGNEVARLAGQTQPERIQQALAQAL